MNHFGPSLKLRMLSRSPLSEMDQNTSVLKSFTTDVAHMVTVKFNGNIPEKAYCECAVGNCGLCCHAILILLQLKHFTHYNKLLLALTCTVPLKSKLPPSRETRLVSREMRLVSLESFLVSLECTVSINVLHHASARIQWCKCWGLRIVSKVDLHMWQDKTQSLFDIGDQTFVIVEWHSVNINLFWLLVLLYM